MHPLSALLATTVINELESSARHHAEAPVRRRRHGIRGRIAARRGPASSASYGPRATARPGRA
jgi:hypothetical protein